MTLNEKLKEITTKISKINIMRLKIQELYDNKQISKNSADEIEKVLFIEVNELLNKCDELEKIINYKPIFKE